MLLDKKILKKKFSDEGFFTYKNAFNEKFILNVIKDINNATDTIKYFDNNKNLSRIEKLYDKGSFLRLLNEKISMILYEVLNEEFTIFKDKFNAKPPGGEGFFAHYDGIFKFIDKNDNEKNGWYEYGDFFISALVALDKCNKENGTIEISEAHSGDFDTLFKNTKNDGTPAIKKEIEDKIQFKTIDLEIGDLLIFLHKCPHRSNKNNSNENRRIIYYTYTPKRYGSKYQQYFNDKDGSKNDSKALVDKKK